MPIDAQPGRRRFVVGAAVLWIGAGIVYFALEAAAAAAFRPAYSYAHDYISDLGVTTRASSAGRAFDSPAAYLMNTAFYVQGTAFLAGAILLVLGLRSRRTGWFLGFAACNAVGNILVGTVHGGPIAGAGGPTWLHVTGAALAIVGGNAAILAGANLIRTAGGTQRFRTVSVVAGVLGFLSLLMLRVVSPTSAIEFLPAGVWERASVYSIIGWQMLTGWYLLTRTSVSLD